jgi:hypothetical protein
MRGETWLANIDGDVVDTLTLATSGPADGNAPHYVHRVAVRGRSPASETTSWYGRRPKPNGGATAGFGWTVCRSNSRLRRYYTEAGFIARGESTVHGTKVALFERRA